MQVATATACPLGRHRGVTLIEACVVVAVTAVVATAAAPSMQRLIEGRRLEGVAARLATDLRFVRTEAVARNEALRVGFHGTADGSCYVVHTGSAAACTCAGSEPAPCSGAAREIMTVALPASHGVSVRANVDSLLFDPVYGTSSPAGTVRVLGTGPRAIHLVVNVMGRIRSCSPGAAVPGYPAC